MTRLAKVAQLVDDDVLQPDGPRWRMRISNHRPVPLDDFAHGYLNELDELEALVTRAEELAVPVRAR